MAEAEQQQQEPQEQPKAPPKQKEVIATKVTGTVKWFNVKSGYGFINRNDTKEDVFVHQSAVSKNNPKKAVRSVGDGEIVEFNVVVGEKGNEAADVTGPNGEPVRGSPYAADKRRFRSWYFPRGRGGRGGPPRRPRESQSEGDKEGATSGGEGGPPGGPRRYRPRRGRGGFRGGSGYIRSYMGPPRDAYQGNPDENGDAPMRGRGPPRHYFRRNFRGGRGGAGGRRPTSQDSQGQGDQPQGGPRGGGGGRRPRYNRRRGGPPKQRNANSSSDGDAAPVGADAPANTTEESQSVQNTTTESTA